MRRQEEKGGGDRAGGTWRRRPCSFVCESGRAAAAEVGGLCVRARARGRADSRRSSSARTQQAAHVYHFAAAIIRRRRRRRRGVILQGQGERLKNRAGQAKPADTNACALAALADTHSISAHMHTRARARASTMRAHPTRRRQAPLFFLGARSATFAAQIRALDVQHLSRAVHPLASCARLRR